MCYGSQGSNTGSQDSDTEKLNIEDVEELLGPDDEVVETLLWNLGMDTEEGIDQRDTEERIEQLDTGEMFEELTSLEGSLTGKDRKRIIDSAQQISKRNIFEAKRIEKNKKRAAKRLEDKEQ